MKLSKALGIFTDWRFAVSIAFWPTVKSILASPSILFRPHALSRLFFAHVWSVFGDGVDGNSRPVKETLITPNARGVVLDVGAGYGHTLEYLDPALVTRYIALEPNKLMHPKIRERAESKGYPYVILGTGLEDIPPIEPVDTIISILTLCSIPSSSARESITSLLRNTLKPGGQLLFFEHVQNPLHDVKWWQSVLTPFWSTAFDGCRLDQPTDVWIQDALEWKESSIRGKEDEPIDHLFVHRIGRLIK